jgi:predicted enzyme related to lactoylglutathione lyase
VEFEMEGTGRFAIDITSLPKSCVEAQTVMISFRVDDLEETVRQLSDRGVAFYPSATEAIFDVGPARVATFQDGAGNWMRLSERKS